MFACGAPSHGRGNSPRRPLSEVRRRLEYPVRVLLSQHTWDDNRPLTGRRLIGVPRAFVMPHYNTALTATAHLPGLDVEVVHRRSPAGDRDEILISLQAVHSLGTFASVLYAANPFVCWAWATRLTWLEAARALMLPSNAASTLQKNGSNVVPFSRRT